MKILLFRPFKRLSDQELMHALYKTFDDLKSENLDSEKNMKQCDDLIKEAKLRNLYCSQEFLYQKILFH